MKPPACIVVGLLCLMTQALADDVPLSRQYASAYETEIGGDPTEAAALYRRLLATAEGTNSALRRKALFRIGACERRVGRSVEAKAAWKQLLGLLPVDDPLVTRTREELKALEREMDRVTLCGRVVDERGQPVSGVYVLAGDWGNAPPAITAENGEFRVERRVAGRLATGERYCLVFAEHPVQPRVAVAVIVEEEGRWTAGDANATSQKASFRSVGPQAGAPAPFELVLHPSLALSGYVVDPNGRAIKGAAVRVTGFVGYAPDIPLPFSFLFPDSVSDSNGQFRIEGLASGLRYVTAAEKESYQMDRPADVTLWTQQPPTPVALEADHRDTGGGLMPASGVVSVREIVLKREGQASIDEQGILRAEVNLNDPSARARLEDVVRRFDKGVQTRSDIQAEGSREAAFGLSPPVRFPFDLYPFALRWIRGDSVGDAPLRREDLRGRVVVYHCSSAYVDASLRGQFPGESGTISLLSRVYGRRGVLCVWIVPSSDHSEDAVRLALETQADIPIAIDCDGKMWETLGVTGYGGNVVVGSEGILRGVCSDEQLFRALKEVLTGETKP